MKASPPKHWSQLDKAMSALELNDTRRAVGLAARLINDKDEPAAAPTTKTCTECLSEIPIKARRCAHCAQPVTVMAA